MAIRIRWCLSRRWRLAGQALQAAGFTVYGHVMEGTGHGISPDGLSVALAFMRERLAG